MNLARPWAQLLAALLVAASAASARGEPVTERVADLRRDLATGQLEYASALGDPGERPLAAARLSWLRSELSRAILEQTAGSLASEVELATRRALVRHTLQAIRAYEQSVGLPGGVETTEWNALSPDGLAEAERTLAAADLALRRRLAELPAGAVAPALRYRTDEVQRQLAQARSERAARAVTGEPRRIEVPADKTVAQVRAASDLVQRHDGAGAQASAERALRLEVELRCAGLLHDPGLIAVRKRLLIGPRQTRGPPPPPHGPPSSEGAAAAHHRRLEAMRTDDPLGRAQAQASLDIHREWLREALGPEPHVKVDYTLFCLLPEELAELERDLVEWESTVEAARARGGADPATALQHDEAQRALEDVRAEVARRAEGPPTTCTDLWVDDALPAVARTAEERARWEERFLRRQALALAEEEARPRAVPRPDLAQARRTALEAASTLDQQRRRALWARSEQLVTETLVAYRGEKATRRGGLLAPARAALRAANGGGSADGVADNVELALRRAEAVAIEPSSMQVRQELSSDARRALLRHLLSEVGERRRKLLETVFDQNESVANLDLPSVGGAVDRPEARFDRLFPRTEEWVNDYTTLTKDLHRAPGGVVIDGRLPPEDVAPIRGIRFGPQGLRAFVGEVWVPVLVGAGHPPDAELVRAAWAFVQDGRRTVAVDLRYPTAEELGWFLRHDPLTTLEEDSDVYPAVSRAMTITSVHVHPALEETALGNDLIAADEVVFEMLPLNAMRTPEENVALTFDLSELRRAYNEDQARLAFDTRRTEAMFYKSIIAARDGRAVLSGGALRVDVTLRYDVFHVPVRFERTSSWFAAHDAALRERVPAVRRLAEFAAVASLLRGLADARRPCELDVLLSTASAPVATPRFISSSGR